jgi:predicted cation transporter
MKPIQFRGKETMSYNKTEQPTAEGAEEILQKYMDMSMIICPLHVVPRTVALDAMHEFATLHAQRIADKMVEEKLREGLIAYGKVVRSWGIAIPSDILECSIDEYLKTRDSHE